MSDSFKLLQLIYLYILHPSFQQLTRMNPQRVLLNLKHIFLLIYFPLLSTHLQASYFHSFAVDLILFHYKFLTQKTKLHRYWRDLNQLLSLKIFHHTPLEQYLDFCHNPPSNNSYHCLFVHKQINSNDSLTKHYQGLLYLVNHKRKFNRNILNRDYLLQRVLHYQPRNHQNSKNCNQM